MTEIKIKLKDLVKCLLKDYPQAREDDNYLFYLVITNNKNYEKGMTFKEVIENPKFPKYESVSRMRRLLQRKYEYLQGSQEIQARRRELEEEVRKEMRNASNY